MVTSGFPAISQAVCGFPRVYDGAGPVVSASLAALVPARQSGCMAAEPLREFNELPAPAARELLLACCAVPSWADRMLAGRPYCSQQDAIRQSAAIVTSLTVRELGQALDGHPRIGEHQATGKSGQPARLAQQQRSRPEQRSGPEQWSRPEEWSRQEQAGASAATAQTKAELADGNAEYERRFGHIYLVCASGRTGAELLALLRSRLRNDEETEWQVVRSELRKINAIRLRRLLAGQA
jgi:2-oxo-4-hydroxy-4-carboxy-5-ureidoimidazoline decarboxylase